jgi:hypothetical protein
MAINLYHNLVGRFLRYISKGIRPNFVVAEDRIFQAFDHFLQSENYPQAERTLRIWYVHMGARTTRGTDETLVARLQQCGLTPDAAKAGQIYLRKTRVE